MKRFGYNAKGEYEVTISYSRENFPEARNLFKFGNRGLLGIKKFLLHEDDGHDRYHNDDIDPYTEHYHLQFDQTIDPTRLENLLEIFVNHKLITQAEKQSFLGAYQAIASEQPKEPQSNPHRFFLPEASRYNPQSAQSNLAI